MLNIGGHIFLFSAELYKLHFIWYHSYMPIYKINGEEVNVTEETENAVIRRWIEKRYNVTLVLSALLIGLLLGIIANA